MFTYRLMVSEGNTAARSNGALGEHEGSFIGESGFAVGQTPSPRFLLKRQIGNVASAVL